MELATPSSLIFVLNSWKLSKIMILFYFVQWVTGSSRWIRCSIWYYIRYHSSVNSLVREDTAKLFDERRHCKFIVGKEKTQIISNAVMKRSASSLYGPANIVMFGPVGFASPTSFSIRRQKHLNIWSNFSTMSGFYWPKLKYEGDTNITSTHPTSA